MAESTAPPKPQTIELPVQYRYLSLPTQDTAIVDTEAREVSFAFSSEAPTTRIDWDLWEYIYEVLSHDAAHCNLDRCNSNAAPLLWNHDRYDQRGVVTKAWIDGAERRAWCTVRFSRSPQGEQLMQDVADGIVSNVSLGYRVFELELTKKVEGDHSTYTATNWEVLEVSFCSIPADASVGVGRSQEGKNRVTVRGLEQLGNTGEPPTMPDPTPLSSDQDLQRQYAELQQENERLRQAQQQATRQQAIRDRFSKLKDQARTLLDQRKLSTAAYESMFSDAAIKRYLEDGNTELEGVEFHLKQLDKYASAPANLGPSTVGDVPLPDHPNERQEGGANDATPKADRFLAGYTPKLPY